MSRVDDPFDWEYEPTTEDTEGGPIQPDLIPTWPPPEGGDVPCGDNFTIYLGISMTDPTSGVTRPVGTSVGPGIDPASSLAEGVLALAV